MGLVCCTVDTMRKWEAEFWSQNLLNVWAADIFVLHYSNTNDLNRSESGTVARSHVLV